MKISDLRLVQQPHHFRQGKKVTVYDRTSPEIKYHGRIYSIINKPINKYDVSPCVDHFYISFDRHTYNQILKRGWEIIYQNKEEILGDIERNNLDEIVQLSIQYEYITYESPIDIEKIDAILIWRVGFMIE
jgi:hypothetical protein